MFGKSVNVRASVQHYSVGSYVAAMIAAHVCTLSQPIRARGCAWRETGPLLLDVCYGVIPAFNCRKAIPLV